MSEKITLQQCCELLYQWDKILILCHKLPDGDTVGSAYGLLGILQAMGKEAAVACSDAIPEKYQYFTSKFPESQFDPEHIISVDVADAGLLGDGLAEYKERVDLAIDHHASHVEFAKMCYVDGTAAANTENIFAMARMLSLALTKDIANALYTGISTDTGCFKYSNTTPKTHEIAAELLLAGAEGAVINKLLYDTKSRNRLALERLAMSNLEFFFEDQCAMVAISAEDMKKTGASSEDFEGISALPRMIEGVEVAVTLRQREDGWKISLRTNQWLDACQVCQQLGGGGHVRAAGGFVSGTLCEVKEKVLETLKGYFVNSPVKP